MTIKVILFKFKINYHWHSLCSYMYNMCQIPCKSRMSSLVLDMQKSCFHLDAKTMQAPAKPVWKSTCLLTWKKSHGVEKEKTDSLCLLLSVLRQSKSWAVPARIFIFIRSLAFFSWVFPNTHKQFSGKTYVYLKLLSLSKIKQNLCIKFDQDLPALIICTSEMQMFKCYFNSALAETLFIPGTVSKLET